MSKVITWLNELYVVGKEIVIERINLALIPIEFIENLQRLGVKIDVHPLINWVTNVPAMFQFIVVFLFILEGSRKAIIKRENIIKQLEKIEFPFIYTTNNLESLYNLVEKISQYTDCPTDEILCTLLKWFWNGRFETQGVSSCDRLEMLRIMNWHDSDGQGTYIFAYENEKQPETIKDLPEGGCWVDLRPVLEVPHRNVNNWTSDNCQKAFETLAKQVSSSRSGDWWPDYIPVDMRPGFMAITVTKDVFKSFLNEENIKRV